MKSYVTLKVLMRKEKSDENGNVYYIYKEPYFRSNTYTIINNLDISYFLDTAFGEILTKISNWLSDGSGWQVEKVIDHYVNITQYVPLRGRSYLPLPEELRNSMHGIINLKNEDNKFAIWCIVRHRNPRKKNPQKISASDYEFMKNWI